MHHDSFHPAPDRNTSRIRGISPVYTFPDLTGYSPSLRLVARPRNSSNEHLRGLPNVLPSPCVTHSPGSNGYSLLSHRLPAFPPPFPFCPGHPFSFCLFSTHKSYRRSHSPSGHHSTIQPLVVTTCQGEGIRGLRGGKKVLLYRSSDGGSKVMEETPRRERKWHGFCFQSPPTAKPLLQLSQLAGDPIGFGLLPPAAAAAAVRGVGRARRPHSSCCSLLLPCRRRMRLWLLLMLPPIAVPAPLLGGGELSYSRTKAELAGPPHRSLRPR